MIDIKKAQDIIQKEIDCKIYKQNINREGNYLLFEKIDILMPFNIDYFFNLYVALAFFNSNRENSYFQLDKTLNEINNSNEKIELHSITPLTNENGNLLIYKLNVKVNIADLGTLE